VVDFAILAADKSPRVYVIYRCTGCGEDVEYVVEMPDHMLEEHQRLGHRWPCKDANGKKSRLVEVSRREVPRS